MVDNDPKWSYSNNFMWAIYRMRLITWDDWMNLPFVEDKTYGN